MSLRSTISTPAGKRRYVRHLFSLIADRYDFITVFLSYGQDRRWKQQVIRLARVSADDRVLDLACGTGDLAFNAAATSRHTVGLDVTFQMLGLAMARARAGGAPAAARPRFVAGDMGELPFGHGQFDLVTVGYGLRNVPDLSGAIREIARVLAPAGRLVSLDFNRPSNPVIRQAYWFYLTVVGSALGLVLHRNPDTYRYIPESIRNYPGAEAVAALLVQHGFTNVRIVRVLGGLMAIHVAYKNAEDRRQKTEDE